MSDQSTIPFAYSNPNDEGVKYVEDFFKLNIKFIQPKYITVALEQAIIMGKETALNSRLENVDTIEITNNHDPMQFLQSVLNGELSFIMPKDEIRKIAKLAAERAAEINFMNSEKKNKQSNIPEA